MKMITLTKKKKRTKIASNPLKSTMFLRLKAKIRVKLSRAIIIFRL
jgi:hypothetical protein